MLFYCWDFWSPFLHLSLQLIRDNLCQRNSILSPILCLQPSRRFWIFFSKIHFPSVSVWGSSVLRSLGQRPHSMQLSNGNIRDGAIGGVLSNPQGLCFNQRKNFNCIISGSANQLGFGRNRSPVSVQNRQYLSL